MLNESGKSRRRTIERPYKLVLISSLLVGSLTLAGCSSLGTNSGVPASSASNPTATQTIKFAEVPRLLEMFAVHVADKEGFMAKQGVKIEYVSVKSGPELVTSLLGGSADMALAAPLLYWPAIKKGEDLVSLVGTVKYNYVLATCGPNVPTPHIKDPFPQNLQDLKGKRVGIIGPGTATEGFAKKLIAAAGLTNGKDVTTVSLGGPATAVSACEAGRADFYTAPPPSQGLIPGAKIVADALTPSSTGDLFNNLITTVYATTSNFASSHPQAVTGVCKALVQARRFLKDPANQDKAIQLLSEETGVPLSAARTIWPQEKEALLVPLTKTVWSAQTGAQLTPSTFVPDYGKYVSAPCTNIVSQQP